MLPVERWEAKEVVLYFAIGIKMVDADSCERVSATSCYPIIKRYMDEGARTIQISNHSGDIGVVLGENMGSESKSALPENLLSK